VETLAHSKSSAGRRLSAITVDQIIAGASNVLITVLAARVLGAASFGLFGIVFIIYVTVQGASRALVCEPLLVHPDEAEKRPRDPIGAALALGLGLAVFTLAAGALSWIWDDRLGGALVVMAVCVPLLVMEDLGRYLGFSRQEPRFALLLDTVWLVLVCVALVPVIALDAESLVWFVGVWAGSGAVAGLLVLWRFRHDRIRPGFGWMRETWDYSWRYLLSYSATQGAALVSSVGLGVIAGARALGGLRGALLLTRPMMTFQAAAVAAGTAEVSRLGEGEDGALRRHVSRTTVMTSLVAIANLIGMLVVPDELGRLVLGATWEVAQPLLLPAGIQLVFLGLISGTRSALLGMRAIRKTVRIDVAMTVLVLVGTLVGAGIDGAAGAYWARAAATAAIAVVWWWVYLVHIRHHRTGISVTPGEDLELPTDSASNQPVT
jgi:O-antigen/teichoic acid export membrane protein